MDKTYNPSFNIFYNIYYKDDRNKKHMSFNLSQKDFNFILSRYGKENILSIEKKNFQITNVPLV